MGAPLHERLGLEFPVVQAPMAGVQDAVLAAAVSNAGGLGSLPCAMLDAQALHSELTRLAQATTRPFNVNFFCHELPAPDPARHARWMRTLAPYFEEFGASADAVGTGPARMPFSADSAAVIDDVRPAVVSFHFGLPSEALMARVRHTGAMIWSSATTVDEARWLEAHGVDAVIAQGLEAGGHRGHFLSGDLQGQMSTLELVSTISASVRVPVIAAGGIADETTVVAALSRGAAAVQVGTAYMLSPECTAGALHRRRLKDYSRQETALTNLFTGRLARGLVNRLMRDLDNVSEVAPAFPLAANALAPLRAAAERRGLDDFSPLWAGQNVALCREAPAAAITRVLGRAARDGLLTSG